MKSKMLSAFGAVILSSEAVFAALVEVTDSYRVSVSASGDGVTASTPKFTGWPEDIPQPIFWFDCNITNGWEIFRGEDGADYVTKIPSLVGDGRFLTTDTTLEGTTFTGWGPNRNKPKPPRLVEFADLPGGPALDFGGNNSKMGMMFNPHNYASAVGGGYAELTGEHRFCSRALGFAERGRLSVRRRKFQRFVHGKLPVGARLG